MHSSLAVCRNLGAAANSSLVVAITAAPKVTTLVWLATHLQSMTPRKKAVIAALKLCPEELDTAIGDRATFFEEDKLDGRWLIKPRYIFEAISSLLEVVPTMIFLQMPLSLSLPLSPSLLFTNGPIPLRDKRVHPPHVAPSRGTNEKASARRARTMVSPPGVSNAGTILEEC